MARRPGGGATERRTRHAMRSRHGSANRLAGVRTIRLPDAPQASSPFWWFWERFTDVHKAVYRASNGKLGGTYGKAPVALVDSVGRKSGKRRTHPLLATKDGDNIIVVASKGG